MQSYCKTLIISILMFFAHISIAQTNFENKIFEMFENNQFDNDLFNSYADSIDFQNELIKQIKANNKKDFEILVYNISNYYRKKYNYKFSIKVLKEVIKRYDKNEAIYYDFLYTLGLRYYDISYPDSTIKICNNIIKNKAFISQKILIKTYQLLGDVFVKKGDYTKALQCYNSTFDIDETIIKKPIIIHSYIGVGNIYKNLKNFDQSKIYYNKALEVAETHKLKSYLANINKYLGIASSNQKKYNEAIQYQKNALKYNLEIDSLRGISTSYYFLGNIYKLIDSVKIALDYYKKSLELNIKSKDKFGIAYMNYRIGNLYFKNKQIDSAIVYLKKSITLNQKLNNKWNLIDNYLLIVNIFIEQKKYDKALNTLKKCEAISKDINVLRNEVYLYSYYSLIYEYKKDYKQAFFYFKKYYKLQDSLAGLNKHKQIAELETRYQTEKKQKENELLKKENELIYAKSQKRLYFTVGSIIGVVLLSIMILFLIKANKIKKEANKILLDKNTEINQQNEEIRTQAENLEQAYVEINTQKKALEKSNFEIKSSINYASRIQSAMIASETMFKKYFNDCFIIYQPKDIVSGDFYWIKSFNDKTIVAAADCTGHGVPGAFVSVLGISLLNEIVNNNSQLTSSNVLESLRTMIIKSLNLNDKDLSNKDGMDVSLIIYDKSKQIIEYSGANNPILIFKDNDIFELKADKQPVGVYCFEKPFTNKTISVKNEDIVYMFSDGFIDQFGGKNNRKYMYRNFKDLIKETSIAQFENQKKLLLDEYLNWKGKLKQLDDILILGLKI